jgi:hypothetical protein
VSRARILLSLGALAATALGGSGCAATAPAYARCGDGIGCAEGRCIELRYTQEDGSEASGRFCSERCSDDADCPASGVCVSVDVDPPLRFLCAPPCVAPGDCFAGTRCTTLLGPADVASVCLPAT